MSAETEPTGGFAGDPLAALNPSAAGGCCGGAAVATIEVKGGCCGTTDAAAAGCCGTATAEAPKSTGCCG